MAKAKMEKEGKMEENKKIRLREALPDCKTGTHRSLILYQYSYSDPNHCDSHIRGGEFWRCPDCGELFFKLLEVTVDTDYAETIIAIKKEVPEFLLGLNERKE